MATVTNYYTYLTTHYKFGNLDLLHGHTFRNPDLLHGRTSRNPDLLFGHTSRNPDPFPLYILLYQITVRSPPGIAIVSHESGAGRQRRTR